MGFITAFHERSGGGVRRKPAKKTGILTRAAKNSKSPRGKARKR